MNEKTTAKWLQFTPGEEVIVKILENKSEHEVTHWVGGNTKTCFGKGCKFCAVGMATRERDHLDVEVNGERKVLTLPCVAFDTMLHDLVAPDPMKGLVIGVLPIGTGSGRRYKFRKVSPFSEYLPIPEAPAQPQEIPPQTATPLQPPLKTEHDKIAFPGGVYGWLVGLDNTLIEIETKMIVARSSVTRLMDMVQEYSKSFPFDKDLPF